MPYKVIYSDSLAHHGIVGQKWGVRRYQNEDGSYTAEGKERRRIGSDESSAGQNGRKAGLTKGEKAVLIGAGAAITIAAAGYLYSKNKKDIDEAFSNAMLGIENTDKMDKKIQAGRDAVAKAAEKAMQENKVKEAWKQFKDEQKAKKEAEDPFGLKVAKAVANANDNFKKGVKEGFEGGIKEGTKKAITVVLTGSAMVAVKKMMDSAAGKEMSAKIYQAANPKKVSSFWKVSDDDKDNDDG